MSFTENYESISVDASGDLSTKQFYFMRIVSGQLTTGAAADGGDVSGVLMDKPAAAGRAGELAFSGVVKVVAHQAIAQNAEIQALATGKADTAASGDYVIGEALEAATASGDIIAIKLGSRYLKA